MTSVPCGSMQFMNAKVVKKTRPCGTIRPNLEVAKLCVATLYPSNQRFERMHNMTSPPAGRLKTQFDRRPNVNSDQ